MADLHLEDLRKTIWYAKEFKENGIHSQDILNALKPKSEGSSRKSRTF